ncbi:MAG: T9SS C-terminal target domain-containing protein [Bacteroidetes bacterium]|nr:MAG: T9SS C-terminal target domain-containing protein [Bacteroidota bacterium]TAG88250.1 MAG: T9SS C-terminal target domain-containing protein [Bacteroidota bacterium]
MYHLFLSFVFLMSFSMIGKAKNSYFLVANDTSVTISKGIGDVIIKKLETPTIVKRGQNLIIQVENTKNEKIIIRLHSSLGRLIREYGEVDKKIIVPTQKFLPGLYFVIIKKQNEREVRKVLVTE